MRKVTVNELRAHHVVDLLWIYVRTGEMPQKMRIHRNGPPVEFTINYPIIITETVDTTCRECLPFPAINFCRGPKTRNLDRKAASILGVEIGKRRYGIRRLEEIFKAKAEEKGFTIGGDYGGDTCMEMFYGGNWKALVF